MTLESKKEYLSFENYEDFEEAVEDETIKRIGEFHTSRELVSDLMSIYDRGEANMFETAVQSAEAEVIYWSAS